MALRLVEVILPEGHEGDVCRTLERLDTLGFWEQHLESGQRLVRVLVQSEDAESIVNEIEARFAAGEDVRVLLLSVEATLPRPESGRETPEDGRAAAAAEERKEPPERVAVMELVQKLSDGTTISRTFVLTLILSSVVAAAGLIRGNLPVIIGAMVIAPLLSPNMALSLATTLGDIKLARRAARAFALGGILGLAFSVVLGLLVPFDPAAPEIATRAAVGLGDIVLALAAGSAGALTFTTGLPAALVGVMVAVALLPPLVTGGLLFGAGQFLLGGRALLLFAANVICINLAGVVTFLYQGVRPRVWWDQNRAARMVRRAVTIWVVLLVILVGLIYLSSRAA